MFWPLQSLFEGLGVHRDSNSQKWELTWECESSFSHSSWPTPLRPFFRGHEPKAKVATSPCMSSNFLVDNLMCHFSLFWFKIMTYKISRSECYIFHLILCVELIIIFTIFIHNLLELTFSFFLTTNMASMFVMWAWLTSLICNIPMFFPILMNVLKDFTHCTIPSRTKPIAYSCPFDLGSIYFWATILLCFVIPRMPKFLLFFYVYNLHTTLLPTNHIYPHQDNHHDKNTKQQIKKGEIREKRKCKRFI